jgi:anaerobic C4-dicarboxylate transporter
MTASTLFSRASSLAQNVMATIFPVDLSTAKFAAVKPSMPLSVGSTFSLMAATASSILTASSSIVLFART